MRSGERTIILLSMLLHTAFLIIMICQTGKKNNSACGSGLGYSFFLLSLLPFFNLLFAVCETSLSLQFSVSQSYGMQFVIALLYENETGGVYFDSTEIYDPSF